MFHRHPSLQRIAAAATVVALLLSSMPPGLACGPFFRRQFLAQGGMSLLETPRFFAEIELKLLARDYPTPFRAVLDETPQRRTWKRDVEDFDAALAAGAIRPPDAKAARVAHTKMRDSLSRFVFLEPADVAALPTAYLDEVRKSVFPSEFADYHEGALAYAAGRHGEARAIWERLLARPESERRYRSVAAAFMIGALGVVEDWDDASQWFERTRDLVRRGFRDPGGLAAASYLRESKWHEQRGDLHAAAVCALRSISAGYATKDCLRPKDGSASELAKFAADPLLRNIHTSFLLAQAGSGYKPEPSDDVPIRTWLEALEAARVTEFAGAERVAWLCYSCGDYREARRWLARAPRQSPRALWLTGKLAARDGKRAESLRAFSAATRILARRPEPAPEVTRVSIEENTPQERLLAEHAIAAIGATEFRTALDSFLRGGHWVDAAYVAERLLTIEQLRDYVSRHAWNDSWLEKKPRAEGNGEDEEDYIAPDDAIVMNATQLTNRLRWLLARRLARAGRFLEARPYFPPEWRPALDRYAQALRAGHERRTPEETRAAALWRAALEARYHGIELLGTETAPDWFFHEGDFEDDDPAKYRQGMQDVLKHRYAMESNTVPLPAILNARATERARLQASKPAFEQRFHYRYHAASIAWTATRMLPDNDPKLAAMLNLAGRWLAPRDPEAADRFYQALESRCYATDLGSQAIARRWFVDVTDPAVPDRPVPQPGTDL